MVVLWSVIHMHINRLFAGLAVDGATNRASFNALLHAAGYQGMNITSALLSWSMCRCRYIRQRSLQGKPTLLRGEMAEATQPGPVSSSTTWVPNRITWKAPSKASLRKAVVDHYGPRRTDADWH